VQYASPLFRLYAKNPRLDVTVAYCSLQGAQPGFDPEFGVEVAWDVPLLDGYRWINPRNRARRPDVGRFFGLVNPGLWSAARGGGFDIVLCYGWHTASFWIATLAAKFSGAKLILTTDAHTIAPRGGSRWKVPLKKLFLPLVLRFADAVVVPSTMARKFVESLGVPPRKVFLTPYVVHNAFFEERARRADRGALRSAWSVPPTSLVALFTGKLVDRKRPLDLLRAVAENESWWAVFAGDGDLRPALEGEAARLGVAARTRFLGFVNQQGLPEIYAAADVLVLPSEHEPFGLVVNEAFACGLPAIVSDACGAAGDLIQDGRTGFTFPVGDVTALASRLRQLDTDRTLLAAAGRNARARLDDWGLAQNAEAFHKACLTVAGNSA
jgi:glycosyltransferase involved in cell wall biosynthesis